MNLLSQLTAAYKPVRYLAPTPTKTTTIAVQHKIMKAQKAYKNAMGTEILTTPQIAARLGYGSSSNISKTLKTMANRGWVKCLGNGPRLGQHGKPPTLWQWIGE